MEISKLVSGREELARGRLELEIRLDIKFCLVLL